MKACATSRPVTGPSATPAPSWPVASQSPGTRRDGPIAGSWSGSHGRSPAHAADGQLPQRRHQARGPLHHRRAHGRVDRGVKAAARAARAHQHVVLPGRLDHRRDLEVRVRAEDRGAVGAVDHLAANERRLAPGRREPDELAPARLERELQAGGESRRAAPRPRGQHHRAGGRRLVGARQPHPAHPPAAHDDRLYRGARAHLRPGRPGFADQRARDRARRALHVVREPRGAAERAGQLRLERSGPGRIEQLRPETVRQEPLHPLGLVGPGVGLGMDDQRALAADAGLRAEALVELVVQLQAGVSQVELRPRVLVGGQHVALPQARRPTRDLAPIEQEHANAAHRELARGGGSDDAGPDHDGVG